MWRQPGRLWTGSRPRACGCNICRNGPQVHLWGKSFDTEQGEPEFSGVLRATPAPGQSTYHLIQFIGPVRDEWVSRIKTAGVQIVDYVPNYTYVVRATPDQIQRLQNRPEIQWTGLYHPGYRLAPPALQSLLSPRETDPAGEYVVEFYADQFPSDMQALLDVAGLTGSEIIPVGGYSDGQSRHRMTVQGQLSRIISLVADTGFSYLSPEARLQLFNDAARTAVGSGRAHEHQLTGAGQVLAVTDSGVDTDHEMFADAGEQGSDGDSGFQLPPPFGSPLQADPPVKPNFFPAFPGFPGLPHQPEFGADHRKIAAFHDLSGDFFPSAGDALGHGTHVAGTMAGDAPEYGTCNRYDGHAHDARLVVMKVFNSMGMWGAGFDFYSVYEKAQQSGAQINNNSWGGPASQLDDPYGMVGHDADRFVADHPDQIMVMAAGNFGEEGRGSIATPGNAKNVLAVGAVLTDQPDSIAPFSSRGPTHDGRIKPDVVAPGGPISSAEADTVDGYVAHQGTSMAAPAVSGAAALVRQYYTDGYYPTGASQPAAGFTPSAALVKATLINGAGEVTGRDSDAYGEGYPNNAQGWGRIDLDSSLHLQGDEGCMRVWDGPEALSSGTGWQETVTVVDGSRELRVHLVWTDPAPAQGADRILVNDLDLQLTAPDGTVYLGNNFTSSNPGYSVPAGEADSVNNVEGIRLVPGHSFPGDLPSGTWSVKVLGANVPDGPQDFALVISGGIK